MCLSGLALGDVPNNQPIGIVMTVLGVVVLDFCADATEGPIRAYLLDVADTEEQDMALNIHAFSAGTTQKLLIHHHLCHESGCIHTADKSGWHSSLVFNLVSLLFIPLTSSIYEPVHTLQKTNIFLLSVFVN